jgi:hypothetical protein
MFESWESNPSICLEMGIEPMNFVKKCIMESMQMFGNGSRTHEHNESVLKPDQCSKKNGNRTNEHVYDNQIMFYYFFFYRFI